MTKKKTKPEPKPNAHCPSYPSAPTDPAERQRWVRQRNAAIAGVDPDEYLAAIAGQAERTKRYSTELSKEQRA